MSDMDNDMKKLIEILYDMGALDVKYIYKSGWDDRLLFKFKNNMIEIRGFPCNDSTAALDVIIKEIN